jgi:hypothetical protein
MYVKQLVLVVLSVLIMRTTMMTMIIALEKYHIFFIIEVEATLCPIESNIFNLQYETGFFWLVGCPGFAIAVA